MQFCPLRHILLRDQWLIERLSKAMGAALFGNNFSPTGNSIENFISHKKKVTLSCPKFTFKPFWLWQWVSIARVATRFPQARLSRPALNAADSETLCVCACPSDQPKLCLTAAPSARPLILQSKPSTIFWNSLRRECQMTGMDSNLDSNLYSAAWTTSLKVLWPLKLQHKLWGVWILLVWILFNSVTDAKFELREVTFLRLIPCTGVLEAW